MDNPFVYGEITPGDSFVGREAELDRLTTDLADGQKVFLISPRRYGKSSLIRQVLTTLGRRGQPSGGGGGVRWSSWPAGPPPSVPFPGEPPPARALAKPLPRGPRTWLIE